VEGAVTTDGAGDTDGATTSPAASPPPATEAAPVVPPTGREDADHAATPASVPDEATLQRLFEALPAARQEAITEQARQRMTPWVLRHFPDSWALRAEILTIVAEQLQFSGLAGELDLPNIQHSQDPV
jgi:hypothetical protein